MSKPFLDSNIVLYLLSGDTAKADKAEAVLAAGGVISVQVLNEVASVCLRKLKMPWEEVDALLLAVKAACDVQPLTLASHEKAVEVAKRFQVSLYDANIVASALLSGAEVLLSEDMQSGMLIDRLRIRNPFIGVVMTQRKVVDSRKQPWRPGSMPANSIMNITPSTTIPDVLIIEPRVFGDARGFFFESFNQRAFNEATGLNLNFVQDNHSRSAKGVLRGLHYQVQQPQGKLVRVVRGAVFDVAVNIRKGSPTFGRWAGLELTEDNHKQLWVPPGFAHGFVVLSDSADFLYKTTDYYAPQHERCIAWNDSVIGIEWPLAQYGIASPQLSAKDSRAPLLRFCELPD